MPSSGGGIRAGRAFMEFFVEDSRVQKGLTKISRTLRSWGANLALAGAAITGVGAAIAGPMALFAREAGQAEAMMAIFQQRFTDLTPEAIRFADTFAVSIKRSRFSMREALSTFQGFMTGLGFARDESFEMGKALTRMSADLGVAFGLNTDDAIRRFISAMSGSSEVLDRFGINLKVAAIDQELLALGFDVSSSTATEQQKTLARLSLSYKAMASNNALGAAVRMSGLFNSQLVGVGEKLKDLRIEIGSHLLAPGGAFLHMINNWITSSTEWIKKNGELVRVIAFTGVALLALGTIIATIGAALTGLGISVAILGIAGTGLAAIWGAIGVVISGVAAAAMTPLGILLIAIGALVAGLLAASEAGKAFGKNLIDAFVPIFTSLRAVSQFISKGEFAKAWETAALGMKLGFKQAVLAIDKFLFDSGTAIRGWVFDILAGIDEFGAKLEGKMRLGWGVAKVGVITFGRIAMLTFKTVAMGFNLLVARMTKLISAEQFTAMSNDLKKVFSSSLENIGISGATVIDDQTVKLEQEIQNKLTALRDGEAIKDEKRAKDRVKRWEDSRKGMLSEVAEMEEALKSLQDEAAKPWEPGQEPEWYKALQATIERLKGAMAGEGGEATGVFGGFSPAALRQMGFEQASTGKRTAAATEQTAQGVEKSVQQLIGMRSDLQGMGAFV